MESGIKRKKYLCIVSIIFMIPMRDMVKYNGYSYFYEYISMVKNIHVS